MNNKLYNKGISYIEFILVISIIFLLTGFASVTMSVVNRNNVNKAADKIATGMNYFKTLSLSKGSNKGAITFATSGGKTYYYFGDDQSGKKYVCNSPCTVKVTVKGASYTISGNTKVRLKINQSTGAFEKAEVSSDGVNFTEVVHNMNEFNGGDNKITVSNKNGKTAEVKLNIHVGTVNVSY